MVTWKGRRSISQKRDHRGRFVKVCGSFIHSENSSSLINLESKKKITLSDYNYLLANNILPKQATYIRQKCVEIGTSERKSKKTEQLNKKSDETESDDYDKFLITCCQIGKDLNTLISPDIVNCYNQPRKTREITELIDHKPIKWLVERPPELVHMIANLCGIDLNTASDKKLSVVSKIIELVYFCRNSKLVLPQHFLENLLNYSLTNSKSCANFFGGRAPGGSYYYLSTWLNEQSNEPIKCPIGLVKAVFDNNQKIGKTYLITGNNVVPSVVMTSNLWISLDQGNIIQDHLSYKPDEWMWNKPQDTHLKNITSSLSEPGEGFRKSRDDFLDYCINVVQQQCKNGSTDFIDKILQKKSKIDSEKICCNCGCEADITYRVCRNCGGVLDRCNLTKGQSNEPCLQYDPYISFSDVKPFLPDTTCFVGEPDFINPNSFKNLIQIIQNIGVRAGIKQYGGSAREWVFIECDGLPYGILRDIMENVWRCNICHECFYTINTFEEHKCFILKTK